MALALLGYKVAGIDKYVFKDNNSFSIDDINGLRRIWDAQGLAIQPQDILRDDIAERYGAVISIATIEHQKDPKKFLENIQRAVRPGGLVYIATPNLSHLLNRVRFCFGRSPLSAHLKQWFARGEDFAGHWREYTLAELAGMMRWLDFEIIAARNLQSLRPRVTAASPRSWYVNFFRLCAYALPGARDTNIIIARKKETYGK